MTDLRTIVFEDAGWIDLLPLVYWRTVGELRCGRHLLIERLGETSPAMWVRPQLSAVTGERFAGVPVNQPAPTGGTVLLINGRWLTDAPPPVEGPPSAGICDSQLAWARLSGTDAAGLDHQAMLELPPDGAAVERFARLAGRSEQATGTMVRYPWDLVAANSRRLEADWQASPRRAGRMAGRIYDGVYLLEPDKVHVGAGSSIKPCTVLDAESGPIWIGQNVRICPHCTIQGPVAICDGSIIQAGAVIREGTTIGPVCKVGGEVEESIIWGYSNKQHDGFLGHACLGAWINIAADSINSDLKNTYGHVRVPINGVEVNSGRMFAGLIMGDHSKSSINASFPTGSVVGFCANVVCNAFPPKFVPSFTWLTDASRKDYEPQRGLAVARTVMERRKIRMSPAEEALFLSIAALCRQIEKTDGWGAPE